jgi:hypothetical protein
MKGILMHRNHNVFVRAIRGKNKVRLTFFSSEDGDIRDGLFGPIFYSPSIAGNDSDCYYLWDFEGADSNHFFGLPPSQIVRMEISREHFDLVEFFTPSGGISNYECGSRGDLSETSRKESDGKNL